MHTLELDTSIVDVWRFDLLDARLLRAADSVLDALERRRASRFVFDRHRRQFMAAHAAVRLVLSSYVGVAADAIVLSVHSDGKPRLEGGGLEFNLSHSGDVAYMAVTADTALGIDVELETAARDIPALAATVFSRDEQDELARGGPAREQEMFFRGWTRKEAYVKAIGTGIRSRLSMIRVGLSEHDCVVEPVPGISRDRVCVRTLSAGPGEHVAVATLAAFRAVRYRTPTAAHFSTETGPGG